MEYFNHGGSAQAHSIGIVPANRNRLYQPQAFIRRAAARRDIHRQPLSAVGFVGQPFTFTVVGANSATAYTASGLPPD